MVHVSPTSYRLGYTNEGLYLYLETSKKELISRDRAYQNGDGFHMVLAIPTADGSPTREFLVLAFSPLDPSPGRRAFVWYRNVDLAFTSLQNVLLPFAFPPPDAFAQISVRLEANHLFPSGTMRAILGGIPDKRKTVQVQFDIVDKGSVT